MKMMLISEKCFDEKAKRAEEMFNAIYKTFFEEELKRNGIPKANRDPLLDVISFSVRGYKDFLKNELIGGIEDGREEE